MYVWTDLNRENIIESLFQKKHILTKKMYVGEFHSKLTYQIQKLAPVLTTKQTSSIDKNNVFIGGHYCYDLDQEGKKSIYLDFIYDKKSKHLDLSEISFFQLCVSIADILLHEIIHMHQYRKRNFRDIREYVSHTRSYKKRITQNYLGHNDEIEAYGFNIACELQDKFQDKETILDFLEGRRKAHTKNIYSLHQYLTAFDKDWQHPVMIKLKKQIVKNIPKAIIGKPFTDKNWINY
ncbi:MAG: hypothetical protein EBU90_09710 [Proteobacteria bacterium]|nr:hypothetical protein [Pseudomonadota bacterium]NBP16282.1 hypothetical protein [bacterium]